MIIKVAIKKFVGKDDDITIYVIIFKLVFILITSTLLHNKKLIHHLYTGMLLFILMYEPIELFYYFGLLCTNLFIIRNIANNRLKTNTLLLLNILIIVIGYRYRVRLGVDAKSPISISSEIMLLVPKIYFLCANLDYTVTSSLKYIFFVPSLAYGPVVPYNELKKGVDRKFGILALKVFQCALLALVLQYGKKFMTSQDLKKPYDSNMILKIINLYLFAFHYRTQYHFIWSFSSICFYLYGLDVSNLMFFKVELAQGLDQVAVFWNYWIVKFFKKSCFLPLKKYGKFYAALLTFMFSALWHGGRDVDFLFLLTFSVSIPILRNNNKIMKRYLNHYVYMALATLQMAFFLSYIPAPFYCESVNGAINVWKNIHFLGHVILLISLIILILPNMRNYIRKKHS